MIANFIGSQGHPDYSAGRSVLDQLYQFINQTSVNWLVGEFLPHPRHAYALRDSSPSHTLPDQKLDPRVVLCI